MDDIDNSVVLGLPLLKLVDLEPQIILDLKLGQKIRFQLCYHYNHLKQNLQYSVHTPVCVG